MITARISLALQHLFAVPLLLLLSAPSQTLAAGACSYGYTTECDSFDFTVTSNAYFMVEHSESNADYETYNATIIFQFGVETITVGPSVYNIGEKSELSHIYTYTEAGYYPVDITLIFEDDDGAASCAGKTVDVSDDNFVKMVGPPWRSCEYFEEMPPPNHENDDTKLNLPTLGMGTPMSPSVIGAGVEEPAATAATVSTEEIGSSTSANLQDTTGTEGSIATAGACSYGYTTECDSFDFTVTSNVYFMVDRSESNADYKTYNATVIFQFGVENITVGPSAYNIGEKSELSHTYTYTEAGYYLVDITLIFEDDDGAASCAGKTVDVSDDNFVKMVGPPWRSCEYFQEMPTLEMAPPTVPSVVGTGAKGPSATTATVDASSSTTASTKTTTISPATTESESIVTSTVVPEETASSSSTIQTTTTAVAEVDAATSATVQTTMISTTPSDTATTTSTTTSSTTQQIEVGTPSPSPKFSLLPVSSVIDNASTSVVGGRSNMVIANMGLASIVGGIILV